MFYDWFLTTKSDYFVRSLVTFAQEKAGLRRKPAYTQNALEGMNRVIKDPKGKGKMTPAEINDCLYVTYQRFAGNAEKAIRQSGPYELIPQYKNFELTVTEWAKLDGREQGKHIKSIQNAPLPTPPADETLPNLDAPCTSKNDDAETSSLLI